jgi:rhamnogalacturonyl hydrolase YesR
VNIEIKKVQKASKKVMSLIDSQIEKGGKTMNEVNYLAQIISMVNQRIHKKDKEYRKDKSKMRHKIKQLKDDVLGLRTDVGDLHQEIRDTKDLGNFGI